MQIFLFTIWGKENVSEFAYVPLKKQTRNERLSNGCKTRNCFNITGQIMRHTKKSAAKQALIDQPYAVK